MNEQLLSVVSSQPYPLLFATISGAHLYGFPSPDSDYDLRGVHILPWAEAASLYDPTETIEVSEIREGLEIDLVTHDVFKFFMMLLKRNGYVLEQLYSPLIVQTTSAHERLKEIAKGCITRNHAHHYLGFSQNQWQLLDKEHPRRVKPLLYVYRVLLTGIYLMQTGVIEANLVHLNDHFNLAYIPDLIARKLDGAEQSTLPDVDLTFYQSEFQRLTAQLEEAERNSTLPDAPTTKAELNHLLIELRSSNPL
jgi:uncharacterized protein